MRAMAATGVPVGMLESFPFTAAEARIEPGELLVLYSDGIPEAMAREAVLRLEGLGRSVAPRGAAVAPGGADAGDEAAQPPPTRVRVRHRVAGRGGGACARSPPADFSGRETKAEAWSMGTGQSFPVTFQ